MMHHPNTITEIKFIDALVRCLIFDNLEFGIVWAWSPHGTWASSEGLVNLVSTYQSIGSLIVFYGFLKFHHPLCMLPINEE